jgi:hypothetical protein
VVAVEEGVAGAEFFAEMWSFDDVPAERLDALAPR